MSVLPNVSAALSSYFSRVKIGFLILILNTLCITFSLFLLPLFLKEQGYGLYQIIILYALYTGLSAAIIPLIKHFFIRRFLMIGFLFFALAVASFSLLPASISFFIYAFFIAANICIFWITLNYIFFCAIPF